MLEKILLVESLELKIKHNRESGLSNLLNEDKVIEEKLFEIMEDIFLSENSSRDSVELAISIRNNKLIRFTIDLSALDSYLVLKENTVSFLREKLSESQSFKNNFYVESIQEIESTEKRIEEVQKEIFIIEKMKEDTELYLEGIAWVIYKRDFMFSEKSIN